jgi:D-alanyl-D-alanine carboxypeptidase/D-alanyl-D-alanine-endopeptidase (penicillin-binding protein 4)
MKFLPVIAFLFLFNPVQAQPVAGQLKLAMDKLEKDDQFAHASIGLYIVNSKTGQVIFDKNAQLGLAPASTQKVVTSAAAFELLGKDYTYTSTLGYEGIIKDGILNGKLIFTGSGDPTLGSWRWKQTNEASFREKLAVAFKAQKIASVNGDLLIDESRFESQATPDGWTWDDIGNYYGAGLWGVNWHENRYDLFLKPGLNVGDPVKIISTVPELSITTLVNELKTGKAGSGDNSIIYLPENGVVGAIRGTVPAGVDRFKVSGSIPDAPHQMAIVIETALKEANINISGRYSTAMVDDLNGKKRPENIISLVNFDSPPLDSINYWFLQESINLYGEALVKTMAYKKKGLGSTSDGIDLIKDLWKSKGIANAELKMRDGSGLSPANRLTAHALVTVMQFARKQDWFTSFYHSLPLQNNIKMKSGYIGGVRSYTGYVKSKTGEEYTFAFIINNFDGSSGAVREKMWKLLDLLK